MNSVVSGILYYSEMKTEKDFSLAFQPVPKTTKIVSEQAQARLKLALPPNWRISKALNLAATNGSKKFDGILTIQNAMQEEMNFLVEVKTDLYARDLEKTIEVLQRHQREFNRSAPMIMARFISGPVRQLLKEKGISYVDATGNLQLLFPDEDFYIRDVGEKSDPWRMPGRPRNSLKGLPVAKVLLALIESSSTISIPELIKIAKSSSGVTYRVVEYLERENLITLQRVPSGERGRQKIVDVKWRKIIERWSEDYGFLKSNDISSCIEPRGLESLLAKLKNEKTEYIITGSLAANIYAPYTTPRLAMIYSKNPYELMDSLNLTPVENGANILIAATEYELFFNKTKIVNGIEYAAPTLAALDLLTSPGRGPSEGEELLNWMEINLSEWKRKSNQ